VRGTTGSGSGGADPGEAGGPAAPPRPLRGGAPGRLVAVVVLLGTAVLAASLAGPWVPQFADDGRVVVRGPAAPPVPDVQEPTPEPVGEVAEAPPDGPSLGWVRPLVATATLLAIALALLHLARRGARRDSGLRGEDGAEESRPGAGVPREDRPDVQALREGVAAAAADLRTAARPADAVIAAWVRLEEAAGASGLRRDPASTPTEFTLTVLDRTAADRDASRVLLGLYLRARFGEERLTADDVAAARQAVDSLAVALAGDGSGP
jgi:hypothetical protein